MKEIIFEVTEDEVDGGYSASALGYGIHTQGDSIEDIRSNIREAVDCYFDETMPRPKLIPVCTSCVTNFSWHEIATRRERRKATSGAATRGLQDCSATRFPRANHDTDQRGTSRGDSATQCHQGQDAVQHLKERCPAPRNYCRETSE